MKGVNKGPIGLISEQAPHSAITGYQFTEAGAHDAVAASFSFTLHSLELSNFHLTHSHQQSST